MTYLILLIPMLATLAINWKSRHPLELKPFLPVLYKMSADYSKIHLKFYDNLDLVLDYLKRLNSQTLAFCASKDECSLVGSAFESSLVINSEFLHENPEVLEKLIENEGFTELCMATTSVFSNGNNVKKKSVKSVIITLLDPIELIQMSGRRRLDYGDDNDSFDLYIQIPTLDELEYELQKLEAKENKLKYYDRNYLALMRAIKDDCEDSELARAVFEIDVKTRTYKINKLTLDKLYIDQRYLEFLHALISENGPTAYCDLIAAMFGKTFDSNMLFASYEDRKSELRKFILSYGEEMTEEMFNAFKIEFLKKRIELFGKSSADNLGGNRKTPGMNSINNRLNELKMGMCFEKVGKSYRRVDEREGEEYEEEFIDTE